MDTKGSLEKSKLQQIKDGGSDSSSHDDGEFKLKRGMGLFSATALVVGTMIGSGIFISPKGMLEGCGSVGMTLTIWCLCGLLTTMATLSYAELGTMIPVSGGEHAYLMYTFNSRDLKHRPLSHRGSRTFGRLPAFLYDWTALFILRPTMYAVVAMALGTYVVKPFFTDCEPPVYLVKLVTVVSMFGIAFVNCYSVKAATFLQNITTFAKLVALAIISFTGIYLIFKGETENLEEGFEDTSSNPSTIAIAFYNGFWAFDGWNSLNFIVEEVKNPYRNLPLAVIIGVPLTTLCYVMANIGYFTLMTKEEIMLSHAVAVTWGDRILGVMSWLMPFFVVVSTLGACNGSLFSSQRLCFSAARDDHFPKFLSFLQIDRKTPLPAVLFTLTIALFLIIPGDISTLIDFFGFASWLFYGITIGTLLILRVTEPDAERPIKMPLPIPIIVFLASMYLIIAPIVYNPGMQIVFALIFILSGVVVYVPFIYLGFHFSFIDTVTIFLQKLLRVAPTTTTVTTKENVKT